MIKWMNRRTFVRASVGATGGSGFLLNPGLTAADTGLNIIGPKEGYSPQIGTLVSMMTWMRTMVLNSVRGMTQPQLDFLLDDKANTIGAMLLHLAATETYYQLNTFDRKTWGSWGAEVDSKWDIPMNLGQKARETIKGRPLNYYLEQLQATREKTLAEFRKRDDQWLLSVDKSWFWGPTNNYCKWFHVCEHESNHNGQIKLVKGRLPGQKSAE